MGKLWTPGSPQFNVNLKTAGLEEQDPEQLRILRIGIDADGPQRKHLSRLRHPLKPVGGGADGIYYRDRRLPFLTANQASVAPGTTQTTIIPVGASSPTILPANYWTVGKTVKVTCNMAYTSGTAGNIAWGLGYGAASNPAAIVVSTARAAVASVGPFGVFYEGYVTCRSIGTAGTLSQWGMAMADLALMLSTAQPNIFPQNGTTVVSTVDTTVGTNAVMPSVSRSAGTDGVVVTDIIFEALN